MHQNVPPQTRQFAKAMRSNATDAERKLWSILRAGRLGGHKFKRQVPLDGYILDFVGFEAKLISEADGAQHLESVHDDVRDRHFEAAGYRTLRLWNADILPNIDGVATMIAGALKISPRGDADFGGTTPRPSPQTKRAPPAGDALLSAAKSKDQTRVMHTLEVPAGIMPSWRAAPLLRSMMRPLMKGPLSLLVTRLARPFRWS